MKLNVIGNTLTFEEEDNSLIAAMVKGAKGKLTIRGRKIEKIKDKNHKVLRDDKNPKNVGKIEKPVKKKVKKK